MNTLFYKDALNSIHTQIRNQVNILQMVIDCTIDAEERKMLIEQRAKINQAVYMILSQTDTPNKDQLQINILATNSTTYKNEP